MLLDHVFPHVCGVLARNTTNLAKPDCGLSSNRMLFSSVLLHRGFELWSRPVATRNVAMKHKITVSLWMPIEQRFCFELFSTSLMLALVHDWWPWFLQVILDGVLLQRLMSKKPYLTRIQLQIFVDLTFRWIRVIQPGDSNSLYLSRIRKHRFCTATDNLSSVNGGARVNMCTWVRKVRLHGIQFDAPVVGCRQGYCSQLWSRICHFPTLTVRRQNALRIR